jgi:hypothetical protein
MQKGERPPGKKTRRPLEEVGKKGKTMDTGDPRRRGFMKTLQIDMLNEPL